MFILFQKHVLFLFDTKNTLIKGFISTYMVDQIPKQKNDTYIDECFKQQFSRTNETKIHIRNLAYRMLLLLAVPGGITKTVLEFHISYFFSIEQQY